MPIERAVPATWSLAGIEVVGVEVGHLGLGDLGDLGVGDGAGLFRPGLLAAFSRPAALRDQEHAVGGVLVMNVNERSS